MLVPSMYDLSHVMAESGYTEEQAFDLGISGDIVYLVVVPELGACRVPPVALSHFMAGADEYTAEGMPEYYGGALSKKWIIKRDKLRILDDSWEKYSNMCFELADLVNAAGNAQPPSDVELQQAATEIASQDDKKNSGINWSFWWAVRQAKDWEACALSLNIDPDSMKHHPDGWMAGPDAGPVLTTQSFPSTEAQDKFEKRLRLLRANRYDRAIFTLPAAQYSGLGPNDVLLSEFAAWGLSIAWNDMPPELVAMARTVTLSPPAHPQAVQPSPAISAQEWDTLVEQEEEARQDPAYKAKYDRAMALYAERDKLLEHVRQDHPHQDPEIMKQLSEVRKEIAESEAGLGDVPLPKASTKEYKSSTPKMRIEPQGGDSLTPTIWTICYDLQEAGKRVTALSVMAVLKDMVTKQIHPLISATAGGVKYEYERGDEKELDSSKLDKRIQAWRKIGG